MDLNASMPAEWRNVLLDFVLMVENEIRYVRTGRSSGPVMRDCIGQWEATMREARKVLAFTREND